MRAQDELRPFCLHGFAFRVYSMFSKLRKHTIYGQIFTIADLFFKACRSKRKQKQNGCGKLETPSVGLGGINPYEHHIYINEYVISTDKENACGKPETPQVGVGGTNPI